MSLNLWHPGCPHTGVTDALCWDLYEDREAGEWVTVDEVGDRIVVANGATVTW